MKSILLTIVLLASAAYAQDNFDYLCRPDVQAAVGELRAVSGTLSSIETAITVEDDGTLRRFQGVKDAAPFKPTPHTVAVLHNHPYNDVRPSRHDMGVAKLLNVPVFVITRDEVWVGTADGRNFQADSFKNITLYTADPDGPPTYGREHPFEVPGVLSRCIPSRLSASVMLKRTH